MDSSRKQRTLSWSGGPSAPAPRALPLPTDVPRQPRGSSLWIERQTPISREHEASGHVHLETGRGKWRLGAISGCVLRNFALNVKTYPQ